MAESQHNTYGITVFLRKDLIINSIPVRMYGNRELLTVEMPDVVVHSVYKHQNDPFVLPALDIRNLTRIIIGDLLVLFTHSVNPCY